MIDREMTSAWAGALVNAEAADEGQAEGAPMTRTYDQLVADGVLVIDLSDAEVLVVRHHYRGVKARARAHDSVAPEVKRRTLGTIAALIAYETRRL